MVSEPIMTFDPQKILAFFKATEKLKTTLRHSWLSDGQRQESVAEHTWMMALLALVLMPHFKVKLDEQKVLTMIIVHDLAEAVTTDLPVWEGQKDKAQKYEAEKAAIAQLFGHLDPETAKNLTAVWEEYEQRQSMEAKFVKIIDTFDVVTQHNAAPLNTWDDNDYLWQLNEMQDAFFNEDVNLRQLKDELDQWSIAKVSEANALAKLDQPALARRQKKAEPDKI
jgi:putative hydrolases of HD superfamily